MIYVKRFFFLLAWAIYRVLLIALVIPVSIIIYPIICLVYYVIKGNIDGLSFFMDSVTQRIWEWILKFEPEKE